MCTYSLSVEYIGIPPMLLISSVKSWIITDSTNTKFDEVVSLTNPGLIQHIT